MDRLTRERVEQLCRELDAHTTVPEEEVLALRDLALQSLSQEAVRDDVPEQCARAVIEGINKGLEGEELLAYSRRPISAAIEQARAITEQQFSFLDKYESGGGEEQTPETNKIVDGLGESEDAVELLIRHAKSLETRWRSAIRALKREPNAAGPDFNAEVNLHADTVAERYDTAGPAPAAPDVECCCAAHHLNYGRCLQCPIHGTLPPGASDD